MAKAGSRHSLLVQQVLPVTATAHVVHARQKPHALARHKQLSSMQTKLLARPGLPQQRHNARPCRRTVQPVLLVEAAKAAGRAGAGRVVGRLRKAQRRVHQEALEGRGCHLAGGIPVMHNLRIIWAAMTAGWRGQALTLSKLSVGATSPDVSPWCSICGDALPKEVQSRFCPKTSFNMRWQSLGCAGFLFVCICARHSCIPARGLGLASPAPASSPIKGQAHQKAFD